MWYRIKSYFHFLIKSTNQYGIHSPFVYDLVINCFYQKTPKKKVNHFKTIKSELRNNHNQITVNDFGKGSKVFKTNARHVSEIVKVAGISTKKSLLLMRIVHYLKCENLLEIGTSVGLSASAMHIGNQKATITTLEGCENTATIAKQLFDKFHFNNINITIGNFENTLSKVLKTNTFDLVYFDGNHQKEATLNYFNQCLQNAKDNTVFIFDDIYWSSEMQQSWNTIRKNPQVTISIDTFFWGVVFFRKTQKKQHFTIRV